MRYAALLLFLATPALAHHEAAVVSVLPGLLVWTSTLAAAVVLTWRWRRRRKK